MDGDMRSAYPQFAWLAHWLSVGLPRVYGVHDCRHVTHHLMLTTSGDADIRWETQGTGTLFHAAAGGISFFPCDRREHRMSVTTTGGFSAFDVMIPAWQVQRVCEIEGLLPIMDFKAVPVFRDQFMEASLLRLALRVARRTISEDIGDEIAARHILLRLCALVGGKIPEWWKDSSVFAPGVMRQLVTYIDAHLGGPVSLEHMGNTIGLSPGHFARKFHNSVGESLGRFMNRRRISASFSMLGTDEDSLLQIALDLGFSSQSHFTRSFSDLTGMTPNSFRRAHQRIWG